MIKLIVRLRSVICAVEFYERKTSDMLSMEVKNKTLIGLVMLVAT